MKENLLQAAKLLLQAASYFLQLLSLIVSFRVIIEFYSEYTRSFPIAIVISGATAILIEFLVRVFVELSFSKLHGIGLQLTIRAIAILFVAISAALTTIGAGDKVVAQIKPPALTDEASTLQQYRDQITADSTQIVKMQAAVEARKYKSFVQSERRIIERLNTSIAENRKRLEDEKAYIRQENSSKLSKYNTISNQRREIHNSFGFLTQVLLVLLIVAYHQLSNTDSESPNPRKQTKKPEKPSENSPETNGKPEGNPNETDGNNNISISPEVVSRVSQLKNKGMSNQEIAQKLKIGKGTVTKALQQRFFELCKSEKVDINDENTVQKILDTLGIQHFKALKEAQGKTKTST